MRLIYPLSSVLSWRVTLVFSPTPRRSICLLTSIAWSCPINFVFCTVPAQDSCDCAHVNAGRHTIKHQPITVLSFISFLQVSSDSPNQRLAFAALSTNLLNSLMGSPAPLHPPNFPHFSASPVHSGTAVSPGNLPPS